MHDDPIIDEVRKVREQIAEKFDFNTHAYFEDIRQRQTRLGTRLVNRTGTNSNDDKSLAANLTRGLQRGR